MSRSAEPNTQTFRDSLEFYLPFFLRYWRETAWSFFFNLLKTFPFYLTPLFVKIIIDNYIPAGDESAIYWMFPIMFALGAANVYFHTLYRTVYTKVIKTISRDLRSMIVSRLQMLSLSFHDKQETGRYYSKIMVDVERIEQFADALSNQIFSSLVVLGLLIAVLGAVNPGTLLTFLAILPVFHLLMWAFKGALRSSRRQQRMANEDLSASVSTFLQTSLLARLHGHETFERQRVECTNGHVIDRATEAEALSALFGSSNSVTIMFFNFMVTAVAAVKVIRGELSLGEMLLFVQYVNLMMHQAGAIIGTFPVFTMFSESVRSIREILTAPDIEHNQDKRKLASVHGEIEFERVTFAYPGLTPAHIHQPALQEISIRIRPGMTVGLAGRSGSGKSTFVNLVLGLYRTESGSVKIDGNPVNELDMREVRHSVGVVNQDPILFTGSILDNITHAYRDVPLDRVVEAARKANADEFVQRLPEGYRSPVGEGGALLSGGQKQRIALARAILRDPAILVLDEATSALDSESENLVQQAIETMAGDRTTLIIAHRLSTIRKADLILYFDKGKIIEQGTHAELMALDGSYARMVQLQSLEREVAEVFEQERRAERLAAEQADASDEPSPAPSSDAPGVPPVREPSRRRCRRSSGRSQA